MKYLVYPYKSSSESAALIKEGIDGKVLLREGGWKPDEGYTVINWGAGEMKRNPGTARVLNKPENVSMAIDKLTALRVMRRAGVNVPDFWTDPSEIPEDAYPVVCRTLLAGYDGGGIVMAATPDDVVPAPLYTRYMKKRDEYRVHVVDGKEVAVQIKVPKRGNLNPDYQIRTGRNGFAFHQSRGQHPDCVVEQAIAAVLGLGLDFGGVDVIYNAYYNRATVLEVNTAPDVKGTDIDDYVKAIKGI